MNKNKIGLALGFLLGAFHLVWALSVMVMPRQMQSFLDWIYALHGFNPILVISGMTLVKLILLVIVTFLTGYILGWVFAFFHDWMHKK